MRFGVSKFRGKVYMSYGLNSKMGMYIYIYMRLQRGVLWGDSGGY